MRRRLARETSTRSARDAALGSFAAHVQLPLLMLPIITVPRHAAGGFLNELDAGDLPFYADGHGGSTQRAAERKSLFDERREAPPSGTPCSIVGECDDHLEANVLFWTSFTRSS